MYLVCVHAVGEIERGIDVEIVEKCEVGIDRNVVLETVSPVFDEIRLEQFVLFCLDRVGETARVAYGNLLVPSLIAHHMLALEGVETADADVQVGHCQGDRRVAHVLRKVHRAAQ